MNQLKEDVICYCSRTTKEQINALIVQGIIELDLISRQTVLAQDGRLVMW
jgi:bacterioferritin-associated ferredoxin